MSSIQQDLGVDSLESQKRWAPPSFVHSSAWKEGVSRVDYLVADIWWKLEYLKIMNNGAVLR